MIRILDQIIDAITDAITGVFGSADKTDYGFYKNYFDQSPKEIEDEIKGFFKDI